jgi:hypothetical protein
MKHKLVGFGVLAVGGLVLLIAFKLAIKVVYGIALAALAIWIVRKITHNGRQS